MFCYSSFVVFRVKSSGGVLKLSVSGKAKFLPSVQTVRRFGFFPLKCLKSIYFDSDNVFVYKDNGFMIS